MGPQLRQDPLRGDRVLIAPGRAKRPDEFGAAVRPAAPTREACDFCRGREAATPAELLVRPSPDGSGWAIRVIPNKYPAISPDDEIPGSSEVIIESPRHVLSLTDLPAEHLAEVFSVYAERLNALRADPRMAYAVVFKNSGPAAGASMEHVHSQVIALGAVPVRIAEERARAAGHAGCIVCEQIGRERGDGRVVLENSRFVAYAPYASRFPYETFVVPKTHEARFEKSSNSVLAELSELLRDLLAATEKVAPGAGYNYVLQTEPFRASGGGEGHWRLELFPRLTRPGGFEWGTGTFINPVSPEEAARRLREVSGSGDER